jgi:hypothetical protein
MREGNGLLYDTQISFALKNILGQYEINEFSLFEIDKISKKFPNLNISISRQKEVGFRIECPLCGEYHKYSYNLNEFVKREMVIGGCEVLGIPLFYIGNKFKVFQRVSKINEVNKNVSAMI